MHGRQASVFRWDIFWVAWGHLRSATYSCLLSIYVPYLLVRRKNTFMNILIYESEIKKVVIFYESWFYIKINFSQLIIRQIFSIYRWTQNAYQEIKVLKLHINSFISHLFLTPTVRRTVIFKAILAETNVYYILEDVVF